jgi:hypothetical protein
MGFGGAAERHDRCSIVGRLHPVPERAATMKAALGFPVAIAA